MEFRTYNVYSLFQPDILLPIQYLETLRKKTFLEPEKHLMLAVLQDAVDCFQKNIFARDRQRKKLFYEAQDWLLAENGEGGFSFQNTCEALGLSPGYVRQGLMRWKRRKLQTRAKPKLSRISATRCARAS